MFFSKKMKSDNHSSRIVLSIMLFTLLQFNTCLLYANTLIIQANPINDATYHHTSGSQATVNGSDIYNRVGSAYVQVFVPLPRPGYYQTYLQQRASAIEFNIQDLQGLYDSNLITNVTFNFYIADVIQTLNNDNKIGLISHLRGEGFTGDVQKDWFSPINPETRDVGSLWSNVTPGWQSIDVTNLLKGDLDNEIAWSVFHFGTAPWETSTSYHGQRKEIFIVSADNPSGLAPHLEVRWVPIPPSLILFLSSIAGLITIRLKSAFKLRMMFNKTVKRLNGVLSHV